MTTGPKDPYSPTGGPVVIGRTWWGTVAKALPFADGWLYQFSVPTEGTLSFYPRPELAHVLFQGHWTDAWNDDRGTNHLGVWVPKSTHDRILPNGPLEYRFFEDKDTNPEAAETAYRTWKAAQIETMSGPIRTMEVLDRLKDRDQQD